MKNKITALLFDLDGTVVDTAPDLIAALTLALQDCNLTLACDKNTLRELASHGSLPMIQAAAPAATEDEHLHCRNLMLKHYQQVNGDNAQLFAGMQDVINWAKFAHIPLGIMTNKPARFTRPLLQKMALMESFQTVISADTTLHAKPHPAPMRLAAQQLHSEPQQILYIGDAQRDIVAAKAANMYSATALWGYIAPTDQPSSWMADIDLQQPQQIIDFLTMP